MGNSFLRGYYTVFNPDLNVIGIAPHSTSTKAGIATGTIPTNVMETMSNQSLWTWLICGSIILGVTLFISLWFHDEMLLYTELWVVVLIETLIYAAVLACIIFLLVPFLNDFFEGDGQGLTAISPTDIGLTVPEGNTPTTLVILSSAALTATWATHSLFKFNSQNKKKVI